MESKRIFPTGIICNTHDEATPDNALLCAVNMRYVDGAWRQVKSKVRSANYLNIGADSIVYYHPQSGKYICLINIASVWYVKAYVANSSGGTSTSLFTITTIGTNPIITHVGNFVYISRSTDPDSFVLFWNDITQAYVKLDPIPALKFMAGTSDNKQEECTVDLTGVTLVDERFEATVGQFNKLITDQREKGYFNGHIVLKYAYRMFDGSLIMHSEPFYVRGGYVPRDIASGETNGFQVNYTLGVNGTVYNDDSSHKVAFDKLKIYIDTASIQTILNTYISCNLIRSVCIFSTLIVEGYSIPLNKDGLYTAPSTGGIQYIPIDRKAVLDIADPAGMWLLKEIPFTELLSEYTYTFDKLNDIDLLNEPITIDNYTHHKLIPTCGYTTNNKIHAGNTVTLPSVPVDNKFRMYFSVANPATVPSTSIATLINNADFTSSNVSLVNCRLYVVVELLTDDGLKRKTVEVIDNFYSYDEVVGSLTVTNVSILLNAIVVYPDIRAKRLLFIARNTLNSFSDILHTIDLTPSNNGNYAYHNNGIYGSVFVPSFTFTSEHDLILLNHELFVRAVSSGSVVYQYSDTIHDYNRGQVSKLTNPFVWDAKNSYRFGSERNTVLAMISAQEPITETVFGLYPVIVFTDGGIYALERGDNDVMYSNVTELNKEVLSNVNGLLGVSGGVLFVTKSGLKVLEGRQISEISTDVEGDSTNVLLLNPYVETTDTVIGVFTDAFPETFLTFIQSAILARSTTFNEIIVSKPGTKASYVFNLDTKSWHTITESYSQFLSSGGYNGGYFYDLNTESGWPVYFMQSRPMQLGSDGYKKINQLLIRSTRKVLANEYDAMYVFGSNDAKTWVCIGKNLINSDVNALTFRNLIGHYRYISYIAMGKGENFTLTGIDVAFTPRYNNKIR